MDNVYDTYFTERPAQLNWEKTATRTIQASTEKNYYSSRKP